MAKFTLVNGLKLRTGSPQLKWWLANRHRLHGRVPTFLRIEDRRNRAPVKSRILIREKLVRAEIAAAKLGIREVGGNNQGPWVKKFLAEVGLPEGYAWCDAFQSYEEHGVAGHRLPIESASVGQTYETAQRLGWVVTRPLRGDLVLYNWTGPGPPFADHIGLVVKVLKLGPVLTLQTVEGNTSSGVAGSQSDGDGVFLRTRVISASQVAFVRIPGTTTK